MKSGDISSFVNYGSFVDFDYIKVGIASPEKILSWSYGEVVNSDTVNYRTLKPERGGLFCARIFGPVNDYECFCGKYRKIKYSGIRCEKCDVDVVSSTVRRERMGHIKLAYPVVNIIYLRGIPSKMSRLLGAKASDIEAVISFVAYIVIDPGSTDLEKYQVLSDNEYLRAIEKYGISAFKVGRGAKVILEALQSFNLQEERDKLLAKIDSVSSESKLFTLKVRLKLIEEFISSGNKPEWMVFTVLPVLPADLRPLVQVGDGKMAVSDLNFLYSSIINRNNRLKKLMSVGAPDVILENECRMLQDAVSALLDNSGGGNTKVVKNAFKRPLKSISDFLKGKNGRLRQNLLGKRVDYSGRSVIVSGPELKLHQCGLPKIMALELFKPFVLSRLLLYGDISTIRAGMSMISAKTPEVYRVLEEVVREHPVLLNRAPTLHRMGIQAFEPKLIDLKAIQLHPLVCRAFNADFDGDQMGVHVPLSIESQIEARVMMLSTNNILSSANGKPMIVPRKDITVGLYYMTLALNKRCGEGHTFYSYDDVMVALQDGSIDVNAKIKYYYKYTCAWEIDKDDVKRTPVDDDLHYAGETTAGRIKLFSFLPCDGKISFDKLNQPWSIGFLTEIVEEVYKVYGAKVTAVFCDHLMKEGFKYATLSGISFGKDDIVVPNDKAEVVASTMSKVQELEEQYREGYITDKERYNKITDRWSECSDTLCDEVMNLLKVNSDNIKINSIALMMNSGARASKAQMKQLAGMKGLIAKPNGAIIETPVISNFKEGLSVHEYFNAAHGARKGNVDTALKTADAGYLTRKLVDVSQDCIVFEEDCGCQDGVEYRSVLQDGHIVQDVYTTVKGRFLAKDIINVKGDIVAKAGDFVDENIINALKKNNITSILVRSPATCKCRYGVCRKCYGTDLSTGNVVNAGTAVGVIAAQTIGEPGTQLTLNTFHIGGVASKKVSESMIESASNGAVRFENVDFVVNKSGEKVVISRSGYIGVVDAKGNTLFSKAVPYSAKLYVSDGEDVKVGKKIADWDPYNIYIVAEQTGEVRLNDFIPGVSYSDKYDDVLGVHNKVIRNWLDSSISLKPSVDIVLDKENANGQSKMRYLLPVGAVVRFEDGDAISVGDYIAKVPRGSSNVVKDITGGLPRVTELFEARTSTDAAIIAGADGTIECGGETKNTIKLILHPDNKDGDDIVYSVKKGKYISAYNGGHVKNGDILVEGKINPHDILRFQGVGALTAYIVQEVQAVYRLQGIDIDAKHIEVIVRYMINKVIVDDKGDTELSDGYQYEYAKVMEANNEVVAKGKRPATFRRVLYGISQSALQTESFLSAAAFQRTVRVLVDASIKGQRDELRGMKESMIVGRLIPAGTGFVTRQLKQKAVKLIGEGDKIVDIDAI